MNQRANAIKKLRHKPQDLASLREHRHDNEVTIQRRMDAGRIRIVKSYSGSLLPLQSIEFRLLSHRKLPKSFRHLVRYQNSTDMTGPEIVMRDCGLDLDDWVEVLGFSDTSPLSDLRTLVMIWRHVLRSLYEFHTAGFVHCDIKADNICIPLVGGALNEDEDGFRSGTLDLENLTLIDLALSLQPVDGIDPRGCYVEDGARLIQPRGAYISRLYSENVAEAQRLFIASQGSSRGHPTWIKLLNEIDWRADFYSAGLLFDKQIDMWARVCSPSRKTEKEMKLETLARKIVRQLVEFEHRAELNSPLPHLTLVAALDEALNGYSMPITFRLPMELHRSESKAGSATLPVNKKENLAPETNSIHKGKPMLYAIDGSNVLLNLIVNGKPSIRLFAKLLLILKERGNEFKLFFDNSTPHLMRERDVSSDWKALEAALATAGIKPHFAPRADVPIEEFCAANNAGLINAHDKIDSWTRKPKTIHRARAGQTKGSLLVTLRDGRGQFVWTAPVNERFTFGGLDFPALDPVHVELDRKIKTGEDDPVGLPEATLMVFALDASNSMNQDNTYDGRSKVKHLNEIMALSFKALSETTFADRLYIAILRFADDVAPLACPDNSEAGFSNVSNWLRASSDFQYMKGMAPGNTNIRLALQRSKELIQDALSDNDDADRIADNWRAVIVLITDGNHVVFKEDGTKESDDDVIDELVDIDSGASALIGSRIDVGCVGIGADLNIDLLSKVASECTPRQQELAVRKKIASMLINGSLLVKVDANNSKYGDAVRAFIDLASSKAT